MPIKEWSSHLEAARLPPKCFSVSWSCSSFLEGSLSYCAIESIPDAASVRSGAYHYTEELLQLEAASIGTTSPPPVQDFLLLQDWAPFLRAHPDQFYSAFLQPNMSHSL